jgi:hypothetical protein
MAPNRQKPSKKLRKAHEGHLEEGKSQEPITDTKSDEAK